MSSTAEKLRHARELILESEHWEKYVSYRDDHGAPTTEEADARSYCAMGACIASVKEIKDIYEMEAALVDVLPDGYESVTSYNDDEHTGHEDIVALFDRAIAQVD